MPSRRQGDRRARQTIMPGLIDVHAHVGGRGRRHPREQSWPLVANLAFGVTTAHDPSNDTETVFATSELVRAGTEAVAAHVLDRHRSSTARELPFKAVVENYDDALRAPAADEGGRRLQRQELQPAAARRAADDPQGGARAADDGGARGRLASVLRQDDDRGRPHGRRALAAGGARLRRRDAAVRAVGRRLHADAHRRLRRPLRRELLVPARRTSGRTSGC